MAATRYCPNCGLERREGERFCRNCGHALGTGETNLHASPVPADLIVDAPVGPAAPAVASPEAAPAAAPSPPRAAPVAVPGPPEAGHEGAPAALPAPPSARQKVVWERKAARLPSPIAPLALGGGAAIVVAVFLPWIAGGLTLSALDLPLAAVWDIQADDSPVKLGFALLLLGGLGAGLSFVPRTVRIRRICGSLGLALVLGFTLQLYRSIDQAGGTVGDVVSAIGIGVYLALAGAICLQLSK